MEGGVCVCVHTHVIPIKAHAHNIEATVYYYTETNPIQSYAENVHL